MNQLKATSVGFSLIELMIVLVIIAILLLVAVPGYQESMKKTRRADGMRDLMELASREERFYAQNSKYTGDIDSPDGLNYEDSISTREHYDLSAGFCEGKADFSTCYVLKAEPKGIQRTDTKCGTLSVDSLGQRSASGTLKETVLVALLKNIRHVGRYGVYQIGDVQARS